MKLHILGHNDMGDWKSFLRNILFGDILCSALAVPEFGTLHQNSTFYTQIAWYVPMHVNIHANHVARRRMFCFLLD